MSETTERSIRNRNLIIGLVVVILVVAAVIVWQRGRLGPAEIEEPLVDTAATDPGVPTVLEDPAPLDAAARRWAEIVGETPSWPEDFASPESCEAVQNDLTQICAAADVRLPELGRHGGACKLLEELAVELAASPPDLSSELRSYETLLGNVFHLFRVTGRSRMGVVRRALGEEELAEPAALALYRWAVSRERCDRSRKTELGRPTLYAYSGFLFNTLGGQAYLRRRAPRVEALACFYGLQVLDGAIVGGHNPQGLDPRPEIPRCRELVAAAGFVFEENYLAELQAMSDRWEKP